MATVEGRKLDLRLSVGRGVPTFRVPRPTSPSATFHLTHQVSEAASSQSRPIQVTVDARFSVGQQFQSFVDIGLVVGRRQTRVVDQAVVVTRPITIVGDQSLAAAAARSISPSTILHIGHRPVTVLTDVEPQIRKASRTNADLSLAVAQRRQCLADGTILVSAQRQLDGDLICQVGLYRSATAHLHQTIFHVLIHEDHLIQT